MTSQRGARRVVERYLHEVLGGAGGTHPEDVISNAILRQKSLAFRKAFGDIEVMPHVIIEVGEFAAVHFSARGMHRGPFQGVPPTGRGWTASCTALFRVEDGRIRDFWLTWDSLAILEQVGGVRRGRESSA